MSVLERHAHHTAVEAFVRDADLEIIPFTTAADKLPLVPAGTVLTVTCSSKLGLDRTLTFATAAAKAGYRVVPHIAARQVTSEDELHTFVGTLDEIGVHDLYVIGGDAKTPAGPYADSGVLLEALAGFQHGITTLGVACYPEGHPTIPDAALAAALERAQTHAQYMVSQMCFNATSITDWLDRTRAAGITLPLHLGLAAPLKIRKLAELSLKIGVGSSVRYLTKQHGFLGNALRGTSYRPEKLLYELGDALASPASNIERLHLFTFNQVEATVAWQADIAGSVTPAVAASGAATS